MDTTQKNNQSSPSKLITVTDSAVAKIKTMMEKEGKQGYGLRVGVIPGGCAGLSYDLRFQKTPYSNDIVLEQGDFKIFINEESVSFLKGIELDYIDTLKESGFKYRNPNASNSCGCGTSFS